jgi:hypothetical protein
MVERTLNSEQIGTIIAVAPEGARRIDRNGVLENAAEFTAGGKLMLANGFWNRG